MGDPSFYILHVVVECTTQVLHETPFAGEEKKVLVSCWVWWPFLAAAERPFRVQHLTNVLDDRRDRGSSSFTVLLRESVILESSLTSVELS